MNGPNGTFLSFRFDLKDWQARAQLFEHNIGLWLPVRCQLALFCAAEVSQEHSLSGQQGEVLRFLIIPVLVPHPEYPRLCCHLLIEFVQNLIVFVNPALQVMSLGQWWCPNSSFHRQAGMSAEHDKVWGQSGGLVDGIIVHLEQSRQVVRPVYLILLTQCS